MIQGTMARTTLRNFANRVGLATTTTVVFTWVAILLLSGSMIPRSALIGAALAIAVAISAYRAVRANEVVVLAILVPLGAVIPPELGAAPVALKYVGFLSFGYVMAAILLVSSTKQPRRVG